MSNLPELGQIKEFVASPLIGCSKDGDLGISQRCRKRAKHFRGFVFAGGRACYHQAGCNVGAAAGDFKLVSGFLGYQAQLAVDDPLERSEHRCTIFTSTRTFKDGASRLGYSFDGGVRVFGHFALWVGPRAGKAEATCEDGAAFALKCDVGSSRCSLPRRVC